MSVKIFNFTSKASFNKHSKEVNLVIFKRIYLIKTRFKKS